MKQSTLDKISQAHNLIDAKIKEEVNFRDDKYVISMARIPNRKGIFVHILEPEVLVITKDE